jgi:hypothetical protein
LYFIILNPIHAKDIDKVDWPKFLSRHDLKWSQLSTDWYSGAFIGNGKLAAMIYQENENALRWDLRRGFLLPLYISSEHCTNFFVLFNTMFVFHPIKP